MIDNIILEDIEKVKSAVKGDIFQKRKCWLLEAQVLLAVGFAMY